MHATLAIEALKAQKHVLVEARMVSTCTRSPCPLHLAPCSFCCVPLASMLLGACKCLQRCCGATGGVEQKARGKSAAGRGGRATWTAEHSVDGQRCGRAVGQARLVAASCQAATEPLDFCNPPPAAGHGRAGGARDAAGGAGAPGPGSPGGALPHHAALGRHDPRHPAVSTCARWGSADRALRVLPLRPNLQGAWASAQAPLPKRAQKR